MSWMKMLVAVASLGSFMALAAPELPKQTEVYCDEGDHAKKEGAYSISIYKMSPLTGGTTEMKVANLMQYHDGKEKTVAAFVVNRKQETGTGDVGVRYSKVDAFNLYISFTNVPTFPAPPNVGTLTVKHKKHSFDHKQVFCALQQTAPVANP